MKVEVQSFQKSINQSAFSNEQIAMIWDFYVTKSVAATAGQRRKISDYGLIEFPWTNMLKKAQITNENIKILLATSINKTLKQYDLQIVEGKKDEKHNVPIEIDQPKIVCLTPFTIADEEAPKGKCGEAESVLTHIRNSFAHGLTYFFDNGNMMLEDKDQRGNITARIILKQKTLLDWISLIDKDQQYYTIVDVEPEKDEEIKNE